MRKVLVTGAGGFVGSAVARRLVQGGYEVLGGVRPGGLLDLTEVKPMLLPDLQTGLDSDWSGVVLDGVDAVVHAAARVHVLQDHAADPLAEFRAANVAGTLRLARRAAAQGVRRFVFISSIKVNGDRTSPGAAFSSDSIPAPKDDYGLSKLEAERGLFALSACTGLEIAVVRPPLVYGPGVKGNFRSLIRWTARGLPLPLGAIRNKRSLIAVDNLADLAARCIAHPLAAGQVWMASDGVDLSTTELLQRVALALDKPARLLPVPAGCLHASAKLVGRTAIAQRLCASLQVDANPTFQKLGWTPPLPLDEAFSRTAADFLRRR